MIAKIIIFPKQPKRPIPDPRADEEMIREILRVAKVAHYSAEEIKRLEIELRKIKD